MFVCGTMTVGSTSPEREGLSGFDCANKCGKNGQRYIRAAAHINDGLSAAFHQRCRGKTINMPNEATVDGGTHIS